IIDRLIRILFSVFIYDDASFSECDRRESVILSDDEITAGYALEKSEVDSISSCGNCNGRRVVVSDEVRRVAKNRTRDVVLFRKGNRFMNDRTAVPIDRNVHNKRLLFVQCSITIFKA